MQNEYCPNDGCTSKSPAAKLSGNANPGWADASVAKIVPNIVEIVTSSAIKWDGILITMDWLPAQCKGLTAKTDGADVINEINDAVRKVHAKSHIPFFRFLKGNDDWMNELNIFNTNQYDMFHTGNEKPLIHYLEKAGFTPSRTVMTVTGTATNRCVMKGSVHAESHGYAVQHVDAASAGGETQEYSTAAQNEEFKEYLLRAAPLTTVPTAGGTNNADAKQITKAVKQIAKWQEEIFMKMKGPPRADALGLLRQSGVRMLPDLAAAVQTDHERKAKCKKNKQAGLAGLPNCAHAYLEGDVSAMGGTAAAAAAQHRYKAKLNAELMKRKARTEEKS